MQFGSTPQCRKGWVYSSYERRCVRIQNEGVQWDETGGTIDDFWMDIDTKDEDADKER